VQGRALKVWIDPHALLEMCIWYSDKDVKGTLRLNVKRRFRHSSLIL